MMISSSVARVVLSGSFRRDRDGLERAYEELISNGCQVLSPHRLAFDDAEFVRDEAERDMGVIEIEKHHLVSLQQSDFLWLHAPGGYVGLSAAFEIGYSHALGIPVFSRHAPTDILLKQFICRVPSVFDAKLIVISNQE